MRSTEKRSRIDLKSPTKGIGLTPIFDVATAPLIRDYTPCNCRYLKLCTHNRWIQLGLEKARKLNETKAH
jgi:hypothetical protein